MLLVRLSGTWGFSVRSVSERRVWHFGEAAVGPESSVASLLEGVARARLDRGDAVCTIAEMSRAAELTPAPADQGRRWAEAACIGATFRRSP